MSFEYRVVQVNKSFVVKGPDDYLIQHYFQDILDDYSRQGWEFQRMDTVHVYVPPSCLASFLGQAGSYDHKTIMTLRRVVGEEL